MAVTERVGSTWVYGNSTDGTSWLTAPSTINLGLINGKQYMARLTFSNVGRIDDIGTLESYRVYLDIVNTSANDGKMYVSTSGTLAPKDVVSTATFIGNWATANGDPVWVTPTSPSMANFKTAIGSATTWYAYFTTSVTTTNRSLFSSTVYPKFEFTYSPGLMRVHTGTAGWKTGTVYVHTGTNGWKLGIVYVHTGTGGWKIGT